MLAATIALTLQTPALIPAPVHIRSGDGAFTLTASTKLLLSGDAGGAAKLLRGYLAPSTGLRLPTTRETGNDTIELRTDASLGRKLGRESYRLKVEGNRVVITGGSSAGLFYGVQTFRQLLPTETLSTSRSSATSWSVPAVEIEDYPRFQWRGAHLDVARHFMPKAFVLKFIDLLAFHKLNTFHWHLTDDQGWRIEIKKYPKLTEVGAWRKDTMLVYGNPGKYSGEPHGGFYTQDDVREIVKYAQERHITVVPEIEMPGHAQAAIAAYPELGNTGEKLEVATTWGVIENVFNVKDSTIDFLKDVIDEVIDLFPSQFIHIGGDECPKTQWKQSAYAQEKMGRLGLKDEHELQSWFIKQMDAHIASKGRRMIGWSEILEGGLAPGAALMVWLGNDGAETAVKSGHDVVMAQTSHTYFDYYQSQDRTKEPHAIGGFLPLSKVYEYEPILPSFTPEQTKHVLGAQFQLWTEYIRDPRHLEYMAFPRGCALSEVAWSPKEARNFNAFRQRLETHTARLTALDVNFRKLD